MNGPIKPNYIVVLPVPPYSDPLNQRGSREFKEFVTVLEVENLISGSPRSIGEAAEVYQRVEVDYRPPSVMVKTFDAQKRKRK